MHSRYFAILVLGVVIAVTPTPSRAQQSVDSAAAFARLKALAGTWDATEKGNPTFAEEVVYTMTGRGSVLIEDMKAPNALMGHMLTSYHLDKGTLVLTHFCGAGNQPRMRVKSVQDNGNRISFEIYDITNLSAPEAYHSTHVDVLFLGEDRVDLVYRGKASRKEMTQVFQLARRKTTH
jgi:hypothetical protein